MNNRINCSGLIDFGLLPHDEYEPDLREWNELPHERIKNSPAESSVSHPLVMED